MNKKLLNRSVILGALATWLVPFIVSLPMVNPETGQSMFSPLAFHGILFVVAVAVVLLALRILDKKGKLSFGAMHVFFATNVVLDWVILIGLLGMPLGEWFSILLPMYIVGIYGSWYVYTYFFPRR